MSPLKTLSATLGCASLIGAFLTFGACDAEPTTESGASAASEASAGLRPPTRTCDDDGDCRAGFVCDVAGCGDEAGTCVRQPPFCGRLLRPQCGCDGVTYDNACERRDAGAAFAYDGVCEGRTCGGLLGLGCDEGTFCDFPGGTCGAADQTGLCEPVPEVCTKEYRPVCGCDGATYGNACGAHAAGVSVQHEGACASGPCCDPAAAPGANGNPWCIEGASCCADGQWHCNEGDGSSTCPAPGLGPVCGGMPAR